MKKIIFMFGMVCVGQIVAEDAAFISKLQQLTGTLTALKSVLVSPGSTKVPPKGSPGDTPPDSPKKDPKKTPGDGPPPIPPRDKTHEGEKSDLNKDQHYKFFTSVEFTTELKNLAKMKTLRLKQLITMYTDLEEKILAGNFAGVSQVPDNLKRIKVQLDQELAKREKAPPAEGPKEPKIDIAAMTEDDLEDKIDDFLAEYRTRPGVYDFSGATKLELETQVKYISQYKTIGGVKYKPTILSQIQVQLQIKKSKTPQELYKDSVTALQKDLADFTANRAGYSAWEKKPVTTKIKDADGNPETVAYNLWQSKLLELARRVRNYLIDSSTTTRNQQIVAAGKIVIEDCTKVLTKGAYDRIMADPILESRVVHNDRNTLRERKEFYNYIAMYMQLAQLLAVTPNSSVVALQKIVRDDIVGLYMQMLGAIDPQALATEDAIKKALEVVQGYLNFVQLIQGTPQAEIVAKQKQLQQALLAKYKSYFEGAMNTYSTNKTAFFASQKNMDEYIATLKTRVNSYLQYAGQVNLPVDPQVQQFNQELQDAASLKKQGQEAQLAQLKQSFAVQMKTYMANQQKLKDDAADFAKGKQVQAIQKDVKAYIVLAQQLGVPVDPEVSRFDALLSQVIK